ncbi:MAG: PIN domain-containing protein [Vicinamibacterales bacterium]
MIVVDTSVWIAARRDAHIATTLDSLIDADEVALALPVRLELWAGLKKRDRKAFLKAFGALIQLAPNDDTWNALPDSIERAADARQRFGLTDLIIAALATDIGGLVWSLDTDFERMERLKLVSRYDPPIKKGSRKL